MTESVAWEDLGPDQDRPWTPTPMPDATGPLDVSPLGTDQLGHPFIAVVRFPPRWHRTGPGWYTTDEEFVVLDGDLEVNGVACRAGDWVLVPPGAARTTTSSKGGALALARFGAPPRWRSGSDAPDLVVARLRTGRCAQALPPGGGCRLRPGEGGGAGTWLFRSGLPAVASWREVLDVDALRWAVLPPGTPLAGCHSEGPLVVREVKATTTPSPQGPPTA